MASSKIKGITIEIDGDTTKLGKALESAESSSKSLQSELKGINSLLKLDPSNVELLTQKQKVLTDAIDATKEKLNTLKNAQAQVQAQFDKGEITEQQFRDFQREIIATEQKLEGLEKQAKEFGSVFEQQVKAASDNVKELGGKVEEAGKKMGGLSAAAGAGLVAAAKSAADNEAAINRYIATTGKAVSETDKYKELMETIYQNNYGESIQDVADKMRIVSNILGDLPDEELQRVVEKSYLLEDAYGMDFQENVRGVNALMDQFGITADQAYELINQGAQKGLNQNQDLTDQIAEYSTYYAKLGFTAEDFFNMMIAGAEDGAYQIDYLNDAMKEFGIRTKDNSKSTNDAYTALGLNVEEVNNKFAQGGDKAQEAFAEVTKAIMAIEDPVKRNEIGVALFGTKFEDLEESAVFAMTSAKDQVNMLGDTVEQTSDTMYGGTSDKAQEALRSIQTAFASLGESLLPIIAPIAEKIAELAKKFSELSPTIQKIILVVTGIVAAFAPVVIVIGKVISAVGVIMPVIAKIGALLAKGLPILKGIGAAIGAVVSALGWPVVAIMAVIAVIVLLWNKCEWFRDGVKAIWEAIKSGFIAAYEWLKGIFIGIGEFFVGVWNKIQEVWAIVSAFFATIGQWIYANVIAPILGFFKGLWDGIVAIFTPVVQWFTELFTSVWQSIQSILNVVVGLFRGTWELIKAVWGVVAQWFNDSVITPIINFFTPIIQWFRDIFTKAWEGIKEIWSTVTGFFQGLWDGIKLVFSTVGTWFKNIFTTAWTGIKNVFAPVASFFSGIWNGIKSAFGSVASWFQNTFSSAWTAVKNVFSTGGKIFDGIKDGIASTFKTVVNAIIGGINKVIAVPFNAINGVLNKIRSVSVAGIEPFKAFIKYNALSVPQIPKLAKGTNKVEKEGLAYLHKNEAVVPKKYNPAINNDVMKDTVMDALTNFTNTKVQNSSNQNGIGELTRLIKQYMPLIVENMGQDIVLDDRTLVGKIAPRIDKELGVIATNKSRGY